MNEKHVNLVKVLDAFAADSAHVDQHELVANLYNEFIGVNAADAKEWYGSGTNILGSIDAAAKFADRIASPAVRAHIGADNIGFKVLYSTVVTLRDLGKYNVDKIPAVMLSCIIRANIMEDAALMYHKSNSVVQ